MDRTSYDKRWLCRIQTNRMKTKTRYFSTPKLVEKINRRGRKNYSIWIVPLAGPMLETLEYTSMRMRLYKDWQPIFCWSSRKTTLLSKIKYQTTKNRNHLLKILAEKNDCTTIGLFQLINKFITEMHPRGKEPVLSL